MTLPKSTVHVRQGYDEVLFDEEVDISDENIDAVSAQVALEFEVKLWDIDWRDGHTLWLWWGRTDPEI